MNRPEPPTSRRPATAILYQDCSATITLLDVPASIELCSRPSPHLRLSSCAPISRPYASTEPKSKKARANVRARAAGVADHVGLLQGVEAALAVVRGWWEGGWCLPRWVGVGEEGERRGKRKRGVGDADDGSEASAGRTFMAATCTGTTASSTGRTAGKNDRAAERRTTIHTARTRHQSPLLLRSQDPEAASSSTVRRLVTNTQLTSTTLRVPDINAAYHIPPGSSFFIDTISAATAHHFSQACVKLHPVPSASAAPGQFDLVILDPPWQNRSATRSGGYKTASRGHDPLPALADGLAAHIADGALVLCWITHRADAHVRALALFDAWDVRVLEKWVWVKTTTAGEPVYELSGRWRRPYEVLLVGRRGSSLCSDVAAQPVHGDGRVAHRFIVGVPDVHSRKPSLKGLLEATFALAKDYRALEVFARHLTAGWCAWGDEVLKFNESSHWVSTETSPYGEEAEEYD